MSYWLVLFYLTSSGGCLGMAMIIYLVCIARICYPGPAYLFLVLRLHLSARVSSMVAESLPLSLFLSGWRCQSSVLMRKLCPPASVFTPGRRSCRFAFSAVIPTSALECGICFLRPVFWFSMHLLAMATSLTSCLRFR
uniref:Replication factor C subunit 3 n=1 Tax=Schistocephalus solidus TaxID=70667 RepID=A0A0V0JBR1_SCHSO